MPITPLDTVNKPVKSAAQNQVRTAQAELRRETSIVGYANALERRCAKKLDQASGKNQRTRRRGQGGASMCRSSRSSGAGRLCAPFPGAAPAGGAGLL